MGIKMTVFTSDNGIGIYDNLFSIDNAREVIEFHKKLTGYAPTPLRDLPLLSENIGVSKFFVKDESYRFGLNAFKGLGGSYALYKVIEEKLGKSPDDILNVPAGLFTFVTATDGNHGRGIAWAAKNLSQNAVVYMPKGSSIERLENIRGLGAKVEITDLNYDDTVRFANEQSKKNGWILVQDTSWDGYETIITWIMQGYMTMGLETVEQLDEIIPTHIFLQAGVGAMAGAIVGFFKNYYADSKMPRFIIAEPDKADCLFRTAKANDGYLYKVKGDLDSIMAGLCCGEVCTVGWKILSNHANYFFSCSDYVAADGMRILGNPIGSDEKIISGESGALTSGLVYNLMTDKSFDKFRNEIALDKDSIILCLSTEGDTDKKNYRRVVWDGWYRNPSIRK